MLINIHPLWPLIHDDVGQYKSPTEHFLLQTALEDNTGHAH